MANVINKTTFQYLESVNTPNYMDGNWIINPMLPTCNKKYFKTSGESIVEMTTEEKAVVDAAIVTEARYNKKTRATMLNEVWKSVTPILEDVVTQYMPFIHNLSGYESGDVIILVNKDTPEQLADKASRKTRYLTLMNSHPIVPSFLEDGAYNDCRQYLQSLIGTVITQDDYNYFDTVIPLQR